jgi:ABC-type glycerol-3-phosphate transport system permease component
MVPASMTLIPQFLIAREFGLLNSYAGLILPTLAGPLGVFLLRQYMLGIPQSLLDAARIDGCREFAVYWRIVLPLSLPALGTLAIITFTAHWREFLWPMLVATDDSMKTLPVGLASLVGQFNTDYGAQMAGALLSVLPVIVVFLSLQRYFIRGLTAGAVKE